MLSAKSVERLKKKVGGQAKTARKDVRFINFKFIAVPCETYKQKENLN